eukprot:IDg2845t1
MHGTCTVYCTISDTLPEGNDSEKGVHSALRRSREETDCSELVAAWWRFGKMASLLTTNHESMLFLASQVNAGRSRANQNQYSQAKKGRKKLLQQIISLTIAQSHHLCPSFLRRLNRDQTPHHSQSGQPQFHRII